MKEGRVVGTNKQNMSTPSMPEPMSPPPPFSMGRFLSWTALEVVGWIVVVYMILLPMVVSSSFGEVHHECTYDEIGNFLGISSALLLGFTLTHLFKFCSKEGGHLVDLWNLISAIFVIILLGIGVWGVVLYSDIPYPGPTFQLCSRKVWGVGLAVIVTDIGLIVVCVITLCVRDLAWFK